MSMSERELLAEGIRDILDRYIAPEEDAAQEATDKIMELILADPGPPPHPDTAPWVRLPDGTTGVMFWAPALGWYLIKPPLRLTPLRRPLPVDLEVAP